MSNHDEPYYTWAMRRLLLPLLSAALLSAALPFAASSQDFEREQRWKSEVLANLVVGDAVDLKGPAGRTFLGLYADGRKEQPAVLLVHGRGVHPDHGVIGILRGALADRGYATLSIQMPVLGAEAPIRDYYPALFPDASARIAAGRAWLSTKGHRQVVLLSHSLGSWMSQYHLEQGAAAPFVAWVCMGHGAELAKPGAIGVPVLEIYGESDYEVVLKAVAARRDGIGRLPRWQQRMISGADHFYTGREAELAEQIAAFMKSMGR